MKPYLLLLACISLTGCTTATNYTQAEYEGNNGNPPKMLFGILKVYPGAAAKIMSTPMIATYPPGTSTLYSTTTIRDSKGNYKTYSTTTTIRSR